VPIRAEPSQDLLDKPDEQPKEPTIMADRRMRKPKFKMCFLFIMKLLSLKDKYSIAKTRAQR
jgi:hypothetical protein